MVDEANEDYLYYGTPIEREEEMTAGHKMKMALDAGQMRRLPPWKQEVTDKEGRRRFHEAQELSASSEFDTFGFTAAEVARKQAETELQTRPSVIPGPVPDEIIIPVAESIGVKLLVKMGWRHGRSIGASDIASISESRREARKAFLAFAENNEPSLSPKMVLVLRDDHLCKVKSLETRKVTNWMGMLMLRFRFLVAHMSLSFIQRTIYMGLVMIHSKTPLNLEVCHTSI